MAKGIEIHRRFEAILEVLSLEGSMTRAQLVEHLRRFEEGIGFPRSMDGLSPDELGKFNEAQEVKVARALREMEKNGLVCRDEISEKKFREPGDTKTQFWKARSQLEPDLEDIAALIALDTIMDSLQWIVPEEFRGDLERIRENARGRVSKMPVHSPEKRWLAAVRVLANGSPFERPRYDDKIRGNIETAIKEKRRVNVVYRPPKSSSFEVVASVTDWVVRLPDTISVVLWKHALVCDGVEDETPLWPSEIPLPWIERVELRKEAAYEPNAAERKEWWISSPDIGERGLSIVLSSRLDGWIEKTYEFRASPYQMRRWSNLGVEDQLEILGTDEDGWAVCRHSTRKPDFLKYLSTLHAEVEILSPYLDRSAFKSRADDLAEMYSIGQQLPPDMLFEIEKSSLLDGDHMLQLEGLDTLEVQTLAESEIWKREPVLIETLCVWLSLFDPKWHVMGDVPRSKIEYLTEAERIATRMPELRSARQLADVLESEFPGAQESVNFEGTDMLLYWLGMAEMIWSETARWRLDRRFPTGKE